MSQTLADTIAPELPYLRRFARALTGTQERGDAYVVAVLETLIADPKSLPRDLPVRTALYQTFLKVWSSVPYNQRTEPGATGHIAEQRIELLTPKPRQAFLLAAVEEFSVEEIASILCVSRSEVQDLIQTAGSEIAEQISARTLIIEDEPLIALDIEQLVTEIGHKVVGIARTRKEASQLATRHKPSLVLADIQLADGSSGIDAVNDILGRAAMPVVFITAYPERLLTGERAEPTFLITKPFSPDMVKAVISQALFFDLKATRADISAA